MLLSEQTITFSEICHLSIWHHSHTTQALKVRKKLWYIWSFVFSSVYAFHVDTLTWWKQLTEVCSNPASFLTSAHLANHSVNWMWLLAWESRRNCQMLFSHPLNPASSQQMLNLASVASLSFSHKSIREVQRWCWLISTWLKVRPTSAPEMF